MNNCKHYTPANHLALSRHAKRLLREKIGREALNTPFTYSNETIDDDDDEWVDVFEEEMFLDENELERSKTDDDRSSERSQYEDSLDDADESHYEDNSSESDIDGSESFDEQTYYYSTTSDKSYDVRSAVFMIFAFYLRHNLTWVALEHLLKLINRIKPGAAPASKYLFSNFLPKSHEPIYHYYCKGCSMYLGEKHKLKEDFGKNDVTCSNCNYKFSFKKKNEGSFFIQLNFKDQIKHIVEQNQQHFSSNVPCVSDELISDIKSGVKYKELKAKYRNLISLTFNTDGVKIFKSRKKSSLWPIQMVINELPKSERYKRENMILIGLWYGNDPDFSVFFKPFVDDLIKLDKKKLKIFCGDTVQKFTVRAIILSTEWLKMSGSITSFSNGK